MQLKQEAKTARSTGKRIKFTIETVDNTHSRIVWNELGAERSKVVWSQSVMKELHHLGLVSNLTILKGTKVIDRTEKVYNAPNMKKSAINDWYDKATLTEKTEHRNYGTIPQWAQ